MAAKIRTWRETGFKESSLVPTIGRMAAKLAGPTRARPSASLRTRVLFVAQPQLVERSPSARHNGRPRAIREFVGGDNLPERPGVDEFGARHLDRPGRSIQLLQLGGCVTSRNGKLLHDDMKQA